MSNTKMSIGVKEFEIERLPLEMGDYIEKLIKEEGGEILEKKWCSKYNNYVVYDYEPFCTDGFDISYIVKMNSDKAQFVQYLYNKRVEQLRILNDSMKLDISWKDKLLSKTK